MSEYEFIDEGDFWAIRKDGVDIDGSEWVADMKALQEELDAYKSHTEDMRKTIAIDIKKTGGNVRLENLLACTPAQSLVEVKAKAVELMLDDCGITIDEDTNEEYISVLEIKNYIELVREGDNNE